MNRPHLSHYSLPRDFRCRRFPQWCNLPFVGSGSTVLCTELIPQGDPRLVNLVCVVGNNDQLAFTYITSAFFLVKEAIRATLRWSLAKKGVYIYLCPPQGLKGRARGQCHHHQRKPFDKNEKGRGPHDDFHSLPPLIQELSKNGLCWRSTGKADADEQVPLCPYGGLKYD